jgi:hypothetical protein
MAATAWQQRLRSLEWLLDLFVASLERVCSAWCSWSSLLRLGPFGNENKMRKGCKYKKAFVAQC